MVSYDDIKDLSEEEIIRLATKYLGIEEYYDSLRIISYLLDQDSGHPQALFIAGKIFLKLDQDGLAETLFRRALERDPTRPEIWGSVGRAVNAYVNPEEAFKYLRKALQIAPENQSTLSNLSNAYALDGQYEKALEVAQRVVEIAPDNPTGQDNLGMAKLALGDWTGWDGCFHGFGRKWRKDVQYGEEDLWDGTKGQKVIVFGEQGLGDEILYGSCIPDVIKDSKEVIIDCDHRLEGLFRRSFPEASVYGTRDRQADWPNEHEWDARCPMGILPMFYRRKEEDFPGKPFLKADPVRKLQWRAVLDSISDRPKIGIAWSGGGKWTNRKARSIPVELFEPLTEFGDLIDLNYEKQDHGDLPIHQWDHATLTPNYDDTAALVSELDIVVTVCTAVVHLSGGLGVPCHVLVAPKPSWRYNLGRMPWYDSVTLHRSKGDWSEVIDEVVHQLRLRKAA